MALEGGVIRQREINEAAGNYCQQILNEWTCIDSRCSNTGKVCYRPAPPLSKYHYKVNPLQSKYWSVAVAREETTVQRPPDDLIDEFIKKQGPVDTNVQNPGAKAKRDEKKSDIKDLVDTYKSMAKLGVIRQMGDLTSHLGQQQQP